MADSNMTDREFDIMCANSKVVVDREREPTLEEIRMENRNAKKWDRECRVEHEKIERKTERKYNR